jgi:hypothetical protein
MSNTRTDMSKSVSFDAESEEGEEEEESGGQSLVSESQDNQENDENEEEDGDYEENPSKDDDESEESSESSYSKNRRRSSRNQLKKNYKEDSSETMSELPRKSSPRLKKNIPANSSDDESEITTKKGRKLTSGELGEDEHIRYHVLSESKDILKPFITEKIYNKLEEASEEDDSELPEVVPMTKQPSTIINCQIRSYQQEGINFLIRNYYQRTNCILADEM